MKWKQLLERAIRFFRGQEPAVYPQYGYEGHRKRSERVLAVFRNGDGDETWIPTLEEVTREEPYNFDIWLLLGIECFYAGQYNKAYVGLAQALKLSPNNLKALLMMGRLLATKRNDIKGAIYYFNKCLACYPNDKYVMGNIAEVYFEIGLYEQALPLMEKTFNPDQYIDYLNLALCYYKTGKLEQAKQVCQRAIKQEPVLIGEHPIFGLLEQEKKEIRRLGQTIVRELSKRK